MPTTTTPIYVVSSIGGAFSNPTNAVGGTTGTWAGDLNVNSNYTHEWGFATTGLVDGTPVPGQSFAIEVLARKGSNSGTPTIQVNTKQNGVVIASGAVTNITSTTGQSLLAFVSNDLLNGTFDNLSVEIVQTSAGGSPSARNSAQVDTISINSVDYAPPPILVNTNPTSLNLVGQNATVAANHNVLSNPTSVTITGLNAEVTLQASANLVEANTGSLTLTGQTALVKRSPNIQVGTTALGITGQPALISANQSVTTKPAGLTVTGRQAEAILDVNQITYAKTAAVAIDNKPAAIKADRNVLAQTGNVAITGRRATIRTAEKVKASVASIAIQTQPATVRVVNNVAASRQQLTVSTHNATVNATKMVQATQRNMTVAGRSTSVSADQAVTTRIGVVQVAGHKAVVNATKQVQTALAQPIQVTTQRATVKSLQETLAGTVSLTITPHRATLFANYVNNIVVNPQQLGVTSHAINPAFYSGIMVKSKHGGQNSSDGRGISGSKATGGKEIPFKRKDDGAGIVPINRMDGKAIDHFNQMGGSQISNARPID